MSEKRQKIWNRVKWPVGALLLVALIVGLFIWPGWLMRPRVETDAIVKGVETTLEESAPTEVAIETHASSPTLSTERGQETGECRPLIWMTEAIADTKDVATLISVLDRDFTLDYGGQWSEPGYPVPTVSVFWTDLFQNISTLPSGVSPIRVQGGWGVYYASAKYVIPEPNGGGRWMRLCGTLKVPKAAVETVPVVVEAIPTKIIAVGCTLPDLTGKTVEQAINIMDKWFEDTAYQWGSGFAVGDKLPAGSVFWTDLGESYTLPSCVSRLATEGNWGVFSTSQEFSAPSAGRYVVCN